MNAAQAGSAAAPQEALVDGDDAGVDAAARVGMVGAQAIANRAHLGHRLVHTLVFADPADHPKRARRAVVPIETLRTGQRLPHIRARGKAGAVGDDPDNRRRRSVDRHVVPKDRWVAAERRLPDALADHGHRRRTPAIVLDRDDAADDRRDPEHVEQLAGDVTALDTLGCAVHIGQSRGAGGERREIGAADSLARLVELEPRQPAVRVPLVARGHEHDAIGPGNREAAQGMRVEDREHHVVHADAERKDEHGGDREATVPRQRADGKPGVQRDRLDQRQAPLIAVAHRDLIHAAEGTPGCGSRLLGRQPLRLELLGEQSEMKPDLVVQPPIAARPEQRIEKPRQQHARAHGSFSNSRLTIDTVRAQLSVAAASCFRPAVVMR